MASAQQPLYSTPAFELFRRGLIVQTVQKFRGINAYSTLPTLGPDWAQDLNNVIVSGSGGLSKLRLPVQLSTVVGGVNTGPNSFWDFQQGNGLRQVVAHFGAKLYYYSNDLSAVALIDNNALNLGQWSFAASNNILFGVNGVRAQKWTGTNWWLWGILAAVTPPTFGSIVGSLSPAFGYLYGWALKNSITGHVGNISPVSASTGVVANKAFTPLAPTLATPDPQTDTIVWFRTLDGGGDMFRLAEVNLNTGALVTFGLGASITVTGGTNNLGITDNSPDTALDQTSIGPLINNPPIVGKYVAVGQGRMFIFNLLGAPQDIAYSGYEQILLGRPEESFPPNNRLRLSIGAEVIAGGGVLQSGIVAFSQTDRMYMLRGQVEDITLLVPVNFTQYLEELPWKLGCMSHFTIQSTPYGLVWLAGDKTLQMFDGRSEPIDISVGAYPLLRRITPGTESFCVSGYFNWLERDIYALLCCVDGSLTINRIFFFAFNKQIGSDQIDTVECFTSDVVGTLPGVTPWIGLLTTSKLQRMLCVGSGGFIYQLPISSDTVNGITQDLTIIPPTNGVLNAFWRGGYFGSDNPERSKMFRFMRLITDQHVRAFQATFRLVDDEERTFAKPEILGPNAFEKSRMGINRRAKRLSTEILFPSQDVASNVLEMQMATIATADR